MHKFDVVVVGAGPAGSYSALCCTKHGLKTLLLDRESFPRDKPCGVILEYDKFIQYTPFLTGYKENISNYTILHYNYQRIIIRSLKSYIYKRKKFDKILVDYAIKAGVTFFDNANVVKIKECRN